MSPPSASRRVVSFGKFEADLVAGELRKNGAKIHLQDQPFQVLALLLENPERAVTREELRQKLWSTDTFVDFDNGLNTAINKIREALGDAAENPRFVETLPRRGYRFIAPVTLDGARASAGDLAPVTPPITPVALSTRQWRSWIISGVAGLFAIAMVLLTFLYFHQRSPAGQIVRFEVPVPDQIIADEGFAVSPDGRKLAFIGRSQDGNSRVWVRPLESLEPRPLNGTEGANGLIFWSPDSRFVAFDAEGKLKRVESLGGPPAIICDVASFWGGAWNRNDEIVFGAYSGLMQVSASGGSPFPLIKVPAATPFFLPDGRHFVYTRVANVPGIYVGSVDTKPQVQPTKRLLADLSQAVYAPSADSAAGYLLFVRGAAGVGGIGTLMAQPFDTRRTETAGDAIPISERVSTLNFSVSATDVLVYSKGPQNALSGGMGPVRGRLAWLDRAGSVVGTFGDLGLYGVVSLSPDGKRVAFERSDPQKPAVWNVWLHDFERGVTTRFTFGSGLEGAPVWSPDGSQIAFCSDKGGTLDLYQKASNLGGGENPVFKSSEDKCPTSWSPDGRFLLYATPIRFPPNLLWFLSLDSSGTVRNSVLIEDSEFNQLDGRFSPNGRWIAYFSDESGRNEIYVRPFDISSAVRISAAKGPPATGKWMVSRDGGTNPLWRRDGKEMFYLSLEGTAMAVEVNTTGTTFQAGIPKAMFKVPPGVFYWDVSADGKRFLMASPSGAGTAAQPPFTVMLNWHKALKK
jgi:eukaryotic-like serine/threonine-protein kinase